MREENRLEGTPPAHLLRIPHVGEFVGLRRSGTLLRTGTVEMVMPDGSGFWLAAFGADPRIYVPVPGCEFEIWKHPALDQEQ